LEDLAIKKQALYEQERKHYSVKKCLDREEARKVIKEIFALCHRIDGRLIKLMPSDTNGLLSVGCQIHIQTNDDKALEICLKSIADSNSLAVHENGDLLIIYKSQ
jgi:hypothetical protein